MCVRAWKLEAALVNIKTAEFCPLSSLSTHLRRHAQLVEEGVVPDLLHVVPVGHDAVLDGVAQGQDAALGLCLVAHVGVL